MGGERGRREGRGGTGSKDAKVSDWRGTSVFARHAVYKVDNKVNNNRLFENCKRVQSPVHQTSHIQTTSIMHRKSPMIEYELTRLMVAKVRE